MWFVGLLFSQVGAGQEGKLEKVSTIEQCSALRPYRGKLVCNLR